MKDTIILTGKIPKTEFMQNVIHHSHIGQEHFHDFKNWTSFAPSTENVKIMSTLDIPSPYEYKVMTWANIDERVVLAVHLYDENKLAQVMVASLQNVSDDVVIAFNCHGHELHKYDDDYWVGEMCLILALVGASCVSEAIGASNIKFTHERYGPEVNNGNK